VISVGLILAAATVTGVAAGLGAVFSGWERRAVSLAAAGAFLGILVWRLAANDLHLNADFGLFVRVGDMGCIVAGALGPAIVGLFQSSRLALPAVVAGLIGFIVNVIIL